MKQHTLTINGVLYATYEMDGSKINICIHEKFKHKRADENESIIIGLIQLLHDRVFKWAGFLNLKAEAEA